MTRGMKSHLKPVLTFSKLKGHHGHCLRSPVEQPYLLSCPFLEGPNDLSLTFGGPSSPTPTMVIMA
jgi:hypothetical protein